MPDPATGTQEEWDAAAHKLEAEARDFLVSQMERGIEDGEDHRFLAMMVQLTAVKVAGDLIYAIDCDPAHAERLFFAYLRGALRGADGPIHDDGRPFTGGFDA